MAVAKCGACKATVTVRFVDGACSTTFGESFRARCKKRGDENTIEPADCEAMQSAVMRAQKRAERERPRANSVVTDSALA